MSHMQHRARAVLHPWFHARGRSAPGRLGNGKGDDGGTSRPRGTVWILKPGKNSNRGSGIEVADSYSDVMRLLKIPASGPAGAVPVSVASTTVTSGSSGGQDDAAGDEDDDGDGDGDDDDDDGEDGGDGECAVAAAVVPGKEWRWWWWWWRYRAWASGVDRAEVLGAPAVDQRTQVRHAGVRVGRRE